MENKKYEELIDLIINENEEKARELFHEIVVEKSREIYENIMADEDAAMHEGDQVQSMMDEIEVDETMSEDESDAEELDHDAEEAGDELTHDMEKDGDEDMDIEDKVDDLEDRIVDAENEIDALIAKFEAELGGAGEEEVAAEDMMEEAEEVEEAEEMDEEEVMEAVQLQKVSVTHGDNGSNTKSPALTKPKVEAAGVKPVKFSGDNEAVPTGPKGPSNEYSKKEGKLIGDVANTPGMKKAPALKAAPKPDTKDGSDKGAKSPVAKA